MSVAKTFLHFATISFLGACGGASTNENVTFAGLSADGRALYSSLDSVLATPAASMRLNGSGTFKGVAGYSATHTSPEKIYQDPDTLSDLVLEVNFKNKTLTGVASNFRSADNGSVTGKLDISAGKITDAQFSATISGTLNNRGTDVNYSGLLAGAFGGSNASSIVGAGSAIGLASGASPQTVNAVFGATEQ